MSGDTSEDKTEQRSTLQNTVIAKGKIGCVVLYFGGGGILCEGVIPKGGERGGWAASHKKLRGGIRLRYWDGGRGKIFFGHKRAKGEKFGRENPAEDGS